MRTPRLFCEELSSSMYQCTNLNHIHHLTKVLRLKPGDAVELFDGKGILGLGILKCISRNSITIEIDSFLTSSDPYQRRYQAVVPYIKKENLIYLVQKLVEIGIHSIVIFKPENLDQSLAKKNLIKLNARIEETIIQACEQSGCNLIPTVHYFDNFLEALTGLLKNIDAKDIFVLDTIADKLAGEIQDHHSNIVSFITGPESGFSAKERFAMDQHGLSRYKMGHYVLRAETAPVVALSKLQIVHGENS